jgi:hypothetical protein
MSNKTPCPVCGQNDWQVMAERTFFKRDTETAGDFHKGVYRFMFEVWFPGQSEIHFKNLLCRRCGLITFSPRPTVDELDTLRRRTVEPTVGFLARTILEIAEQRSRIMYDSINRRHPMASVQRVLDYGGSDGSLMRAFLDNGHDCVLVDYCPVTMEGITKIGNTVYDLQPEDRFDLIVCNHIIEHVAAPQETLAVLTRHLSETGLLFVEVPLEVWKYPPLLKQKNPITHVNFFTPNSLKNLFWAAGASVVNCEITEYLHTDGRWNPGLRCMGRRQTAAPRQPAWAPPDGLAFLNPGLKTYLKYYGGCRRKLKAELTRRLKPEGRQGTQ